MTCPKCGKAREPDTIECPYCGVIYEKYGQKSKLQKHPIKKQPKKPVDVSKLKKCDDCGHEVSVRAKECPSCGAPLKNPQKIPQKKSANINIGCLVALGVMLLIWIFSSLSTDDKSPGQATDWHKQDNFTAYYMMEGFVKDRLKSPKTADFPGTLDGRDKHVTYLKNQKYRIVSYVDSQNSFGALIRTHFIGEIEQIEKDRWQMNSLVFDK